MAVKLPKVPLFGKNCKVWGWTQTISLTPEMHVAFAHLNAGGYSSRHYHESSWNRFYVCSGLLQVTVYRNDKEEVIVIKAGETLDIEPKLAHRMKAVTDCDIIEIYWSNNEVLDVEDIVRADDGGLELIYKIGELKSPYTLFPDRYEGTNP